jgi:stage II sporulation protein D
VLRRALPVAAAFALAFSGAASAYLLGRPAHGAAGTTTAASATTTTLAAKTAIVLNGHGWGHGLGMSQWGAYGFANRGWTYDRILAHYYRGTTLGTTPVKSVRVLLADGKGKVTLSATTPWRVVDEEGTKHQLEPAKIVLTPKLELDTGDGETLSLGEKATFNASPVSVNGKPYRGAVRVSVVKDKLRVVNVVGLEAYLKGVVPSEMPSAWHPEALKAQAVAARTYAIASLKKGADYDLYNDVRSQVYGGLAAESLTASAALDATAGKVVFYDGKVITAYFFSTSGGRTVSAGEVTGRPVPYLVSVADPYDTASPYHDWGPVLLDAAKVAKQLKTGGALTDLLTTLGPSGRVKEATAVTATGESTFSGTELRKQLELRSTWFTVGWLALTPPPPVTFGGAGSLAGVARGVGPVSLEARVAGSAWQPAGAVTPGTAGAFTAIVRPQVTTEYRLVAGNARAGLVKVGVAPKVDATISETSASGSITPIIAGAPVQLQRQDGAVWTTVGTSTTDVAGAFTVTATDPVPGTFRVRVAPGHGLVPGFSQPSCCR